jgi:hypothetical protein
MTLAPQLVICPECCASVAYDGVATLHHAENGAHVFAPTYGIPDATIEWSTEPHDPTNVQYVAWGGTTRTLTTTIDLGRGVHRTPDYGIRRAIWDAAFGYVSGFRKRDIAYYLLTRSISRRIERRTIAREARTRP